MSMIMKNAAEIIDQSDSDSDHPPAHLQVIGNANGQPTPGEGRQENDLHATSPDAGPSSAFEHRIDIPEEVPFLLALFESLTHNEAKVKIGQEKAIEFFKMFVELSSILKFPHFIEAGISSQISFMTSEIGVKLKENRQKIGESLFEIVTDFSNKCELLGVVGEANVQRVETIIQFYGRSLCFIGLFTSVAAFINTEITKILKNALLGRIAWNCAHWVNRIVRQKLGLADTASKPVPTQFLERQTASQIFLMHSNMTFYAASIEMMSDFWTNRTKSIVTGAQSVEEANNFQSLKVKKHLEELTPEALYKLISKRIELEQCEN
uniref:Ras-GAP domain-containing protein n=1 Tax=Globodera pallida TaxID=36090 RepID=A0A183C768_GLOPA